MFSKQLTNSQIHNFLNPRFLGQHFLARHFQLRNLIYPLLSVKQALTLALRATPQRWPKHKACATKYLQKKRAHRFLALGPRC